MYSVYAVNNVIYVKTGLDWRNLRLHVTFRIVPTTDEKWQTRSDLSESVCS